MLISVRNSGTDKRRERNLGLLISKNEISIIYDKSKSTIQELKIQTIQPKTVIKSSLTYTTIIKNYTPTAKTTNTNSYNY